MPPFLVSYFARGMYQSHVLALPAAPRTRESLSDLLVTLAMEAVAPDTINFDELPGPARHPARQSPYSYRISYRFGPGAAKGEIAWACEDPILTIDDLRYAEVCIGGIRGSHSRVVIVSCRAVATVSGARAHPISDRRHPT